MQGHRTRILTLATLFTIAALVIGNLDRSADLPKAPCAPPASADEVLTVAASATAPEPRFEVARTATTPRSTTLHVRFEDEHGRPVTGIACALLRLGAERDFGDDWLAAAAKSKDVALVKADSQGVATWNGLDGQATYRWGLLSAVSIDQAPVHERRRYELMDDGSIEVGKAAPPGLSGRIRFATGQDEQTFTCQVHSGTHVRGYVQLAGEPVTRPVLQLFHREPVRVGDRTPAILCNSERYSQLEASAPFEFRRVRPGDKLLMLSYEAPAGCYHVVRSELYARALATTDAGTIAARHKHALRVSATDADGSNLAVSLFSVRRTQDPNDPTYAHSVRLRDRHSASFVGLPRATYNVTVSDGTNRRTIKWRVPEDGHELEVAMQPRAATNVTVRLAGQPEHCKHVRIRVGFADGDVAESTVAAVTTSSALTVAEYCIPVAGKFAGRAATVIAEALDDRGVALAVGSHAVAAIPEGAGMLATTITLAQPCSIRATATPADAGKTVFLCLPGSTEPIAQAVLDARGTVTFQGLAPITAYDCRIAERIVALRSGAGGSVEHQWL